MADFLQFVTMLREQMNATLSRSDVLKPLSWLIGILLTATVVLALSKSPEWLLTWLAVSDICLILLYAIAYVFFGVTNPDALRSEKYSLNKMAIEHGLYGDNTAGILPAPVDTKAIAAPNAISVKAEDAAS